MLVRDILEHSSASDIRRIITTDCSVFLEQSQSLPLYKLLPSGYEDFHRVKVRRQKRSDGVSEMFDRAFGHQFSNLRQRAVFTTPVPPLVEGSQEPFYVFPTNGYRFMYSKEVTNSGEEYATVIDTLVANMSDLTEATEIVTDLLKYTYTSVDLTEGLSTGAEIILYNIPYYYAVRTAAFPHYLHLIT